MNAIEISTRVRQLIAQYGGIRPAARALKMDAGYLLRLKTGEKMNPGPAVLKKLGIVKLAIIQFHLRKP